jgi:hypothetical protein
MATDGQALVQLILDHVKLAQYTKAQIYCDRLKEKDPELYDKSNGIISIVYDKIIQIRDAVVSLTVPDIMTCIINDGTSVVFDVATHMETPTGFHLILDGIADASFFFMCVTMKEVGEYSSWCKIFQDSYYTLNPDFSDPSWRKCGMWWLISSPFPLLLDNRDACVNAEIFDCMDNKEPSVLIVITESRSPAVPAGCRAETIRMKVHEVVISLKPTHRKTVQVSVSMKVDFRMKYMPTFLQKRAVASMVQDAMLEWIQTANEAERLFRLDKSSQKTRNPHVEVNTVFPFVI